MMIIDPPVTPYSTRAEIEAWLAKLAEMDQDDESVQSAIRGSATLAELAQGGIGGAPPYSAAIRERL